MAFSDILAASAVEAHSPLRAKDDVLRRLAKLLSHQDADRLYRALVERERIGSTAMERGLALPHCALADLDTFSVAVLSTTNGIDFGSIDKVPSRLFVAVAGPERERTTHVRLLSSITKFAREPGAIERLIAIESSATLYDELVRNVHFDLEPEEAGPFSLIHVALEGRDRLERALETLSGEVECSIQVTESRSAGSYLNRMPLFSTFWNADDRSEHFAIDAIIPRRNVNAVIRRLEEQLPSGAGAIVSVVELSYASGRLEL